MKTLTGSFLSFQRPAEETLHEVAEPGNDLNLVFQNQPLDKEHTSKQAQAFWHVAQTM